MSKLSKFLSGTLNFKILTTNCYETIHTWNPNCYLAIMDALPHSISFCIKTYGTLYLINSLIRAKGNIKKIHWKRLILNTLKSSLFLTINLTGLLFFMCKFRQIIGFYIWPSVSFPAGFISSILAIFIEAKSRRSLLALYLTNLASESVYRQLMYRGYLRAIPHAETLIFSIGLAVIFFLLNKTNKETAKKLDKRSEDIIDEKKINKDEIFLQKLINFTHYDFKCSLEERKQKIINTIQKILNLLPKKFLNSSKIQKLYNNVQQISNKSLLMCVISTLQHSLKNFGLALIINIILTFLQIVQKRFKGSILQKLNELFKIPIFFATIPLIYQTSRYVLKQTLKKKYYLLYGEALSGALSGISMLIWPSINVSMFILWKAIELLYKKLVNRIKYLPNWEIGSVLLYALSSGYVVGIAVIEPQALRKNYYNFLCQLTGNKLQLFNRALIESYFGFNANCLYKKFVPKLNSKFLTLNPAVFKTWVQY